MKTVLEGSIKVFWGVIGLIFAAAFVQFLWHLNSPHAVRFPLGWLFAAIVLSFDVLVVYFAYLTVFHFSRSAVHPTVAIVSVIMFAVAMNGQIERSIRSSSLSIMPPVELLILFVMVYGSFGFYRRTPAILAKMLFPVTGKRYEAARLF